MKDKIYNLAPNFIQNILITIFNVIAYKKRYGGNYNFYVAEFKKNRNLSFESLKALQNVKFKKLLEYSLMNSSYYREVFKLSKSDDISVNKISDLPMLPKESFRNNLKKIYTISKKQGIVSKTGGTTGKSLEVIFTPDNMQERFAMLDDFRSRFGYKLGKKTAWFSGKNLLNYRDIKKNRFWKTDYFYKVRYYSTFHIKQDYLKYYIDDIITYAPEYMVGFPSTMVEIARYGIKNNISFPINIIKAVFPTAETVTDETRYLIETFFKTNVYDQYASSEGAPFIFECKRKNLHLELQSGIFEVLDKNDFPTKEGRLVVTSFTTYGTPLIRYDIEDNIELSNKTCECGNNNPLVEQILGRVDDYVYSPQTGKINLGNVSNTLKGVKGIIKFQVLQENLDSILIKIIKDKNIYSYNDEKQFLNNWEDRIGGSMKIHLDFVDDIPHEKSGKYRMVKNNIKHLVE